MNLTNNQHAAPDPDSNPFSTRFTRPGAMRFQFEQGESCRQLLEQLAAHGWRGEIVGPHGSGKSTLVEHLLPELASAGRLVVRHSLRRGQRRLERSDPPPAEWNCHTQLVVDGCEQLSWWNRWRLWRHCRRSGAGLLVTTHRPLGLPTLRTMRPSATLVRRLARQLWPEHDRLITDREIDLCFEQQERNVRETLYALYDLYELRTSPPRDHS